MEGFPEKLDLEVNPAGLRMCVNVAADDLGGAGERPPWGLDRSCVSGRMTAVSLHHTLPQPLQGPLFATLSPTTGAWVPVSAGEQRSLEKKGWKVGVKEEIQEVPGAPRGHRNPPGSVGPPRRRPGLLAHVPACPEDTHTPKLPGTQLADLGRKEG